MQINFLNNYVNYRTQEFKKNNLNQPKTFGKTSSNPFEYYNALSNYNISFVGKNKSDYIDREPIYAIDVFGNYKKFDGIGNASKTLEIPAKKIQSCVDGDIEYYNGLIFTFASGVETNNKPDNYMIEVSSDILKEVQKPNKPFYSIDEIIEICNEDSEPDEKITRVRNIPDEDEQYLKLNKNKCKNPFYIMDELGSYKKFYSHSHVEKALGAGPSRIIRCLRGLGSIDGFAIAPADEIEIITENGDIILDLDKLKSKFKEPEGFYAVDRKGNYQKFNTLKEAGKELGIPYEQIIKTSAGRKDVSGEYIFPYAHEVETVDTDGKIIINYNAVNKKRSELEKDAIYLINDKGYTRYNNSIEAGEAIGVSRKQVTHCIEGHRKTVRGYAAVKANEVERYDKYGKFFINQGKINRIYAASQEIESTDISENGFYAINENGECEKFNTLSEATNALGIHGSYISSCLKGNSYLGKGYAFAYAEDIELEDENGDVAIDTKQVEKIIQDTFRRNMFYSIDNHGRYILFEKIDDARDALNVNHASIGGCLAKRQKVACGYSFVKASEIETRDADGNIVLKPDVYQEYLKNIVGQQVYAIDKDGNYKKFSTKTDAINALGVNRPMLCKILNGKAKFSKGWTFASAYDVESFDKDGNITVNEDKIRKIVNEN